MAAWVSKRRGTDWAPAHADTAQSSARASALQTARRERALCGPMAVHYSGVPAPMGAPRRGSGQTLHELFTFHPSSTLTVHREQSSKHLGGRVLCAYVRART